MANDSIKQQSIIFLQNISQIRPSTFNESYNEGGATMIARNPNGGITEQSIIDEPNTSTASRTKGTPQLDSSNMFSQQRLSMNDTRSKIARVHEITKDYGDFWKDEEEENDQIIKDGYDKDNGDEEYNCDTARD